MKGHITAINTGGKIVGFQLRHTEGSQYFAVRKLGGIEAARDIAHKAAGELGVTIKPHAGKTQDSIGIRWQPSRNGVPALYVSVNFYDHQGARHCTSYSTSKHGLTGALDLAIFARECAGHKVKNRSELLAMIQAEYETGNK